MPDKENIPPTDKQLDACMAILKRVGTCDADEDGQPLFELSMANADRFIKQHYRKPYEPYCDDPAAWGIPNH